MHSIIDLNLTLKQQQALKITIKLGIPILIYHKETVQLTSIFRNYLNYNSLHYHLLNQKGNQKNLIAFNLIHLVIVRETLLNLQFLKVKALNLSTMHHLKQCVRFKKVS